MPNLNRMFLYLALVAGYVLSAVLLTLLLYQRFSLPDSVGSKNNGLDESSLSVGEPDGDRFDESSTSTTTTQGSLDWLGTGEQPDDLQLIDDYATAYPVEKLELELSSDLSTSPSTANSNSGSERDDRDDVTIISDSGKTDETSRHVPATKNRTLAGSAKNLCETDECVLAAANVIRLLNRKADPCDDFYEFACGRYAEAQGLDSNDPQVTANRFPNQIEQTYKFLVEKTLERQTSASSQLSSSSKSKNDDEFLSKIRGFYQSCMHQSSFTKYLTELKKFLFGIGSISARSTDLTRIVGELVLRDVFPLFGIAVHRPPMGDGSEFVDGRLSLTAPTRHLHPFALQPSSSSSATFVKIDSIVDLLADELSAAFGIDKSTISRIDKDMETSRLRNLYASTFVQQNRDCEKTIPLASMPTQLGNFSHLFDWQGLVRFLVATNEDEELAVVVDDESSSGNSPTIENVCFSNEFGRYMLAMEPVFANISKMELLLYSTFKAGQHLVNYWTVFEEHGNSFSRRAECYKLVHDNFRDFIGEIVRNNLVQPEVEQTIANMSSIIRKITPNYSSINLQDVLHEIEKVRSEVPEIRRQDELIEIQKKIPEMAGRSFLPNVLSVWKFKNLRELAKVGSKKIDLVRELDLILSLKAQAAFVPTLRQVRIYPLLLGLMSPELGFSGKSLPTSFVYGTLGFAIAHEYAHVLQYYQEQLVRNQRDHKFAESFRAREDRRKECLNERNSEVLRERIRRLLSKAAATTTPASFYGGEEEEFIGDASDGYLSEVWADVLGLKLAFYAFQQSNNNINNKLALPGLANLTASQLFFVSFSQVFCSKSPPINSASYTRMRLSRSVIMGANNSPSSNNNNQQPHYARFVQFSQSQLSHPPNYVRATLPLQLFRSEFAQAFHCPAFPTAVDDCT